jgi:hypothetical protein
VPSALSGLVKIRARVPPDEPAQPSRTRVRARFRSARAVTSRPKSVGTSGAGNTKASRSGAGRRPTSILAAVAAEESFVEVVNMIQAARGRALTAVNTTLIDLYWQVGEFISRRIETEGWGKGTVSELSTFVQKRHPDQALGDLARADSPAPSVAHASRAGAGPRDQVRQDDKEMSAHRATEKG